MDTDERCHVALREQMAGRTEQSSSTAQARSSPRQRQPLKRCPPGDVSRPRRARLGSAVLPGPGRRQRHDCSRSQDERRRGCRAGESHTEEQRAVARRPSPAAAMTPRGWTQTSKGARQGSRRRRRASAELPPTTGWLVCKGREALQRASSNSSSSASQDSKWHLRSRPMSGSRAGGGVDLGRETTLHTYPRLPGGRGPRRRRQGWGPLFFSFFAVDVGFFFVWLRALVSWAGRGVKRRLEAGGEWAAKPRKCLFHDWVGAWDGEAVGVRGSRRAWTTRVEGQGLARARARAPLEGCGGAQRGSRRGELRRRVDKSSWSEIT